MTLGSARRAALTECVIENFEQVEIRSALLWQIDFLDDGLRSEAKDVRGNFPKRTRPYFVDFISSGETFDFQHRDGSVGQHDLDFDVDRNRIALRGDNVRRNAMESIEFTS